MLCKHPLSQPREEVGGEGKEGDDGLRWGREGKWKEEGAAHSVDIVPAQCAKAVSAEKHSNGSGGGASLD